MTKDTDAVQLAVDHFERGFLCSQALFMAFAPRAGLAEDVAARIAAPFGSGVGRLGRTCGAVSGALMALGLRHGHAAVEDVEAKELTYAAVREFVRRFEALHGSSLCREILGYDVSVPEQLQAARETGAFNARCPGFIRDAAQIVEDLWEGI